MKLLKNKTHIYGFEDYNIVSIWNNVFKQTWEYSLPYYFDNSNGSYIITKDLPFKISEVPISANSYWNTIQFEPALCENHKELLTTAKKVYTHPSCKLSRSLMAEKYKKTLNPYLSDAVVIPTPNYDELRLESETLFINEKAKILVKIRVDTDDADTVSLVNGFHEGEILRNCVSCSFITPNWHKAPFEADDILGAEFMYAGPILYIPNSQSYVLDLLTNTIPADKIVYEESVQESLSNETNQLTFDSLTSIKDMLESSDENTVAAGLKSLSMMDWMHYPNSVRLIFCRLNRYNWRYNNATNSTSVKYMLNTLSSSNTRRHWPGNYDNDIYEQDYELFKQLTIYYDNVSEDKILESIKFISFMTVTFDGILRPNIKKRAV